MVLKICKKFGPCQCFRDYALWELLSSHAEKQKTKHNFSPVPGMLLVIFSVMVRHSWALMHVDVLY